MVVKESLFPGRNEVWSLGVGETFVRESGVTKLPARVPHRRGVERLRAVEVQHPLRPGVWGASALWRRQGIKARESRWDVLNDREEDCVKTTARFRVEIGEEGVNCEADLGTTFSSYRVEQTLECKWMHIWLSQAFFAPRELLEDAICDADVILDHAGSRSGALVRRLFEFGIRMAAFLVPVIAF